MQTDLQVATTLQGRTEQTKPKRSRKKPEPQPELLSRYPFDLRLAANKRFNQIVADITKELGGEKCLTPTLRYQIEAFAGCAVTLDDFNARRLLGRCINLAAFNTTVSNLVRDSQCLGLKRTAKGGVNGPGVQEYVRDHYGSESESAQSNGSADEELES